MDQVLPGIWHWTALHEKRIYWESHGKPRGLEVFTENGPLGLYPPVHSYYLEETGTFIDPMIPDEGIEWFGEVSTPERIVITSLHHDRFSATVSEFYDIPVYIGESAVSALAQLDDSDYGEPGIYRLPDRSILEHPLQAAGVNGGDVLAPGLTVCSMMWGSLDWHIALHVAIGRGVLIFGDGLINVFGGLGLIPAELIRNFTPEADDEVTKESLGRSLGRIVEEYEFDSILFAHGDPILTGAKVLLAEFAANPKIAGQ